MERTLSRATLHFFDQPLSLLATLQLWRQRVRTRRQLARLDARGLADIGITTAERQAELAKPFWR